MVSLCTFGVAEKVTGAFNPAVAVGVDFGSAGQGIYWCMFYTVFEFIGAALAAATSNFFGDASKQNDSAGKKFVSEAIGTFFLISTRRIQKNSFFKASIVR